MPEFPEVNLQVKWLRERVVGFEIADIARKGKHHFKKWLNAHGDAETEAGVEAREAALRDFFVGSRIDAVTQRGKHVVFRTPRGPIVTHLMLKARFSLSDDPFLSTYRSWTELPPDWCRGVVFTDPTGRELVLFTPDWKGRMTLYLDAKVPGDTSTLTKLGPEVLAVPETDPDFAGATWTLADLEGSASRSRKAIKAVLMDQKQVAGIGNVYACEALYDAGVHPARPANKVDPDELAVIYEAVRRHIQTAIDTGLDYTSIIRVYRNETDPDGNPVECVQVGKRDSWFVPAKQR